MHRLRWEPQVGLRCRALEPRRSILTDGVVLVAAHSTRTALCDGLKLPSQRRLGNIRNQMSAKGGIGFQLEIHPGSDRRDEADRPPCARGVGRLMRSVDCENGCELNDAHVWICKEELMNHGEKTTEQLSILAAPFGIVSTALIRTLVCC